MPIRSGGLKSYHMTRNDRLQLAGWGLFILCALLYIITSIEAQSMTNLLGSVVFLIACFFFIVPLIWKD
jgi:hypothetical protein